MNDQQIIDAAPEAIGLVLILAILRKLPAMLVAVTHLANTTTQGISQVLGELREIFRLGRAWLEADLRGRGIEPEDRKKSNPEQVVRLHREGRKAEARAMLASHDPEESFPEQLRDLHEFLGELLAEKKAETEDEKPSGSRLRSLFKH